MSAIYVVLVAIVAAGVGAAVAHLLAGARAEREKNAAAGRTAAAEERVRGLEARLEEARRGGEDDRRTIAELREKAAGWERRAVQLQAEVERERQLAAEKLKLLDEATAAFRETFQALSAVALESNNRRFLELAARQLAHFQQQSQGDLQRRHDAIEAMVKPIAESLVKVDGHIGEVEKRRAEEHGSLRALIGEVKETQQRLYGETQNLVKALRAPHVRGRWGEIQLRRVVEIAGMVEHCDFTQQETIESENGRQRPDMIVKLPNGRCVAVDSKVPLSQYLEALEATDEGARLAALRGHAAQVRAHLAALSSRAYQDALGASPEFVVLFLPGETFFSAALEQDPALIELGAEQKVILATPTTLIALLKAVAYGWRQERLAENARAISENGRVLYERIRALAGHLVSMGKGLDRAVASYNRAVGSVEHSVLPGARRFKDLGSATGEDIPALDGVERVTRTLAVPELTIPDLLDAEAPAAD